VSNARDNKKIPIHGTGNNMREWIWVEDNCYGVEAALLNGKPGGVYHFGTGLELSNVQIVKKILEIMGKPESLIEFVSDRPGNDLRYCLDCEKTYDELCWRPNVNFEDGIRKTIEWYVNNPDYWEDEKERGSRYNPA
jgi:dTDP-glucose 4,6-dehydratase